MRNSFRDRRIKSRCCETIPSKEKKEKKYEFSSIISPSFSRTFCLLSCKLEVRVKEEKKLVGGAYGQK